jgi:transcriptional regulator with XRE-family HTH domain
MSTILTLIEEHVFISIMKNVYSELGLRVRYYRQQAQMTQLELARRVGLGRTSITNIELGQQHIPLHLLYPIAHALGQTPQKLLPATNMSKREGVE